MSEYKKNQTTIYVKQGTTICKVACFSNAVTFEKRNIKKPIQIASCKKKGKAKTKPTNKHRACLINYPKPAVPITISDYSSSQGTAPTEVFQIKLTGVTNTFVFCYLNTLINKNSATQTNYYDSIKQHCFFKKEHARPPPKTTHKQTNL